MLMDFVISPRLLPTVIKAMVRRDYGYAIKKYFILMVNDVSPAQ